MSHSHLSMMNGCARLRFDFSIPNHHNTLTFELWLVISLAPGPRTLVHFSSSWSLFGSIQEFCNLTLPMSHYKWNGWLEKVEIGIWALKWSPQHVFVFCHSCGRSWLGLYSTSTFVHQDWVTLGWFRQFTASQPFRYLVVSIRNCCARLRFDFNMYNHHHIPKNERLEDFEFYLR